jgi:hypothetical protein
MKPATTSKTFSVRILFVTTIILFSAISNLSGQQKGDLKSTSSIDFRFDDGTNVNVDGVGQVSPGQRVELARGNYHITARRSGFISAETSFSSEVDKRYLISVSLSMSLPNVKASDVGRETRVRDDSYKSRLKPTTTRENKSRALTGMITGILGIPISLGLALGAKINAFLAIAIGVGGTYFAADAIMSEEVTDWESVRNNNELERESNAQVDDYNRETQRMINIEQAKRYQANAIQITHTDLSTGPAKTKSPTLTKLSSLEHLLRYVGQMWFNVSTSEPEITARLRKLLGADYEYYMMLCGTQTPIELEQVNGYKFLVINGWKTHDTSRQCVILCDIVNDEIHVGVSDEVTLGSEPKKNFFHEGHPEVVQYSKLWKEHLFL